MTSIIFSVFLLFSSFGVKDFIIPENPSGFIASQGAPNIFIAGDAMLSRSVGAMTKKYGTNYITSGYNPFENAQNGDFILFNLESPFSYKDRDVHKEGFLFASHPRNIEIIKWLTNNKNGIISLANNHIFNAGFDGLETTLHLFEQENIVSVGLSRGVRQDFVQIVQNNQKYCFGGYSYDGRMYIHPKTKEKWFVNSLADAKTDIETMNSANCDHKIFLLHWGAEYQFYPSKKQKELAYYLIDRGATLIAGSHSHTFGHTEMYKNRPIFYSFGNMMFDQEWGRKKCEPGMACIFDKNLNKKTVPTYIGTMAKLSFPYQDFVLSYWDITIGKLKKRENDSIEYLQNR